MKTLMWIPDRGSRKPRGSGGLGRWLGLVVVLALLLGAAGLAVSAHQQSYPLVATAAPPGLLRGAFHVHTRASDGRGSLADVAAAAKSAGLSFVVVTDHNLDPLPPPQYLDGVLLVQAVELSTPFGHVVSLGTSRPLTAKERDQDPIGTIHALGGKAVLAHPVQERNPWRDWVRGVQADGIELYSADTFLRQTLSRPLDAACAAASYLGNPSHALMSLVEPDPGTEATLLALAADQPRLALVSHDAHGWPPYEKVFAALSLYLPDLPRLSPNPIEAAREVLAHLTGGHSYGVFDALGHAPGFALEGVAGREGRVGQTLTVRLPPTGTAQVKVTASGAGAVAADGRTLRLTHAGRLEVEVWMLAPGCVGGPRWRPWIVPNPLLVRPVDTADNAEGSATGGSSVP